MNLYEEELKQLIRNEKILKSKNLENKTFMIAGATGAVGKCMVDMLMQAGAKIIALSRSGESVRNRLGAYIGCVNFKYALCDVNSVIPECGDADYIIYAAGNTHPIQYAKDPIGTLMTSVVGTQNLLEYAVKHKVKRFCFLSTVEIYGENNGLVEDFGESDMGYINCNTVRANYPEGKRAGEALCNAYASIYGIDFVIARLSRLYGPTMPETDSKVIAQFLKNASANENIILKSDGLQTLGYTYITDAVMGILYTLLCGKSGEAYNISDDNSGVKLRDVAEFVAQRKGLNVIYDKPAAMENDGFSHVEKSTMNSEKLKQLGWKCNVNMWRGLEDLIDINWPVGVDKKRSRT